jgi:hypothetical protein
VAMAVAMAGGMVLDVLVDLFERDFGGFHGRTRGVGRDAPRQRWR